LYATKELYLAVIGQVASEEDVERLRTDLQLLIKWSADWQMLFNIEKCKVLHIGYNNKCSNYFNDYAEIQSAGEETDLGVYTRHYKNLAIANRSHVSCININHNHNLATSGESRR